MQSCRNGFPANARAQNNAPEPLGERGDLEHTHEEQADENNSGIGAGGYPPRYFLPRRYPASAIARARTFAFGVITETSDLMRS